MIRDAVCYQLVKQQRIKKKSNMMASAEDFKIRCRRNPRGRARAGQDERPALEDQIEATTNRPRTENLNIGNICSSRKTLKND